MARPRNATGRRTTGSSVDQQPSERRIRDKGAGSEPSDSGGPSKPPNGTLAPGLYLVATPIGNARDITLRALDVLAAVDVIACEDTRVTGKLLKIHGFSAQMLPYHEHNAGRVLPLLMKRLKNGERVALVADAGTPLISDPGYRLVRACIAEGVAVTTVPGASAVLSALVLSGLPSDRFLFAGFLPPRQAARRRALAEVGAVPASLVFLESPRRLAAALADMAAVLGARDAAVGRELTKLFEEVRRGPLAELAAHYDGAAAPKGEVTVVVGPPAATPAEARENLDRRLTEALEGASVRDAAQAVAAATGLPRRQVYARALELVRGRR